MGEVRSSGGAKANASEGAGFRVNLTGAVLVEWRGGDKDHTAGSAAGRGQHRLEVLAVPGNVHLAGWVLAVVQPEVHRHHIPREPTEPLINTRRSVRTRPAVRAEAAAVLDSGNRTGRRDAARRKGSRVWAGQEFGHIQPIAVTRVRVRYPETQRDAVSQDEGVGGRRVERARGIAARAGPHRGGT